MSPLSRLSIAAAMSAAVAIGAIPSAAGASDLARTNVGDTRAQAGGGAHGDLMRFLFEPVADANAFEGKRVAIVASDGASAFELETTRDYFMDRGAHVHILAPRPADRAPLIGLAAFSTPRELLTLLDYAGERRLVAVTWYLDQVNPQDYDAIYVPNNLGDIQRLASNSQAMRFVITAQVARLPIFVSGNARAVVPGLEVSGALDGAAADSQATRAGQSQVYASDNAFDMPQLIGALAATLAAAGGAAVN
jgi:hypothetical protein